VDNKQEISDMPEEDWAKKAIEFVTARELFEGDGEGHFMPDQTMDRAMFVTVLWRLMRQPDTDASIVFDDVPEGEWYSEAIAWAYENGIIEGYGDEFGLNDPVTREQIAVILWRLKGKPEPKETIATGCSDWAVDAMSWAVKIGIIEGDEGGYRPTNDVKRVECAAILMRYINLK
jgi:hypothetical protein